MRNIGMILLSYICVYCYASATTETQIIFLISGGGYVECNHRSVYGPSSVYSLCANDNSITLIYSTNCLPNNKEECCENDDVDYIGVNPENCALSIWDNTLISMNNDNKNFEKLSRVVLLQLPDLCVTENYFCKNYFSKVYFVNDCNNKIKTLAYLEGDGLVTICEQGNSITKTDEGISIDFNNILYYGGSDFTNFIFSPLVEVNLDKETGDFFLKLLLNGKRNITGIKLDPALLSEHRKMTNNGDWITGDSKNYNRYDATFNIMSTKHILVTMYVRDENGKLKSSYRIIYNKQSNSWKKAKDMTNKHYGTIIESGSMWVASDRREKGPHQELENLQKEYNYYFYNFDGEEIGVWKTNADVEFLCFKDDTLLYREKNFLYFCPFKDGKVFVDEKKLVIEDDYVNNIH